MLLLAFGRQLQRSVFAPRKSASGRFTREESYRTVTSDVVPILTVSNFAQTFHQERLKVNLKLIVQTRTAAIGI
jgi:hypothetical protein